jgi:peptide/nickel transport system substrate-binding protein
MFAPLSCGSCRVEPPKTRPLILGTIEEPDTLDPLFTEVAGAQEVVRLLFRDLTAFDEHWQLVPQLAEALPRTETSTSGKLRVYWKLQPGLTWSNGQVLTTEDVLAGYRIAADPSLESIGKQSTDDIEKLMPTSPLEFWVEWKRPHPGYASTRVHPILPAKSYPDPKDSTPPFRGFGRTPISNGPYRLKEWRAGEHLTLEPNPFWSGKKPEIEAIVFRFFKTEDAFEAELSTGGIDALGEASGLSLERAAGFEERLAKTHVVQYSDSGLFLHLGTRADHPLLGRPEIRRAISWAIDRAAMAKIVYGGRAEAANGCFPPRHAAHQKDLSPIKNDVEAAKKLMNGQTFAVQLQLASGSQASERAAAFVQAELKKIGIEVTLEAMPLRALFGKMRERTHAPLTLYAWRSSPDWDAYAMLHSTGAQNYGAYKDETLDRLLDRAKHEVDPQAWAAALGEVELRYGELLPSIPLLFRQAVSVRPRALGGWTPTGSGTPVTFNAENWSWKAAN